MLRSTRDYLGMIRFSHTIFALPFAFLAAVLAWRDVSIQWTHIVGILLCMVFALGGNGIQSPCGSQN